METTILWSLVHPLPPYNLDGGFPELGVTFWGVPNIRTIVFWGLYWDPPILGNYQILGPKP